jgi:hypothetical protein
MRQAFRRFQYPRLPLIVILTNQDLALFEPLRRTRSLVTG